MEKTKRIKARHVKNEVISKAKWIELVEVTYQDEKGETRKWESANRCTRNKSVGVDGVDVIATVKRKDENDKIILVKQYRPPIQKYWYLEFPPH